MLPINTANTPISNQGYYSVQQELKKHTDIRFEFDELTFGRRVENLVFYIHSNDRKTVIEATETTESDLPKRQQSILAF